MAYRLLHEAFDAIEFRGAFGVTGTVEPENKLPKIIVEGVGRLSWPINEFQIQKLKNVMVTPLPLGKGSDEKPLQIDCSKIEIDNSFDHLVEIVANQLGVECNIEAKLHKLVLYEEGERFDWHQNITEKSKGIFGSLMIHLPSYHEGGELLIRHERTLIESNHSQQDGENGFFYSAFYSDCYFKVNPIIKGHTFTLLFDLVMKDNSSSSSSSTKANIIDLNANKKANSILDKFIQTILLSAKNDHIQPRFIFPLIHKYSGANRSLIKGRDRDQLSLLRNMKDENGNDLFFIALGHGKRTATYDEHARRDEEDEDDYEDEEYYWNSVYDKIEITTYLPNSLFSEPSNFRVYLTKEESKILFSGSIPFIKAENERITFVEQWHKESFAMVWLADHHFPIISEYNDITGELCKFLQTHPTYGNKYLDRFIEMKKNDQFFFSIAASTR